MAVEGRAWKKRSIVVGDGVRLKENDSLQVRFSSSGSFCQEPQRNVVVVWHWRCYALGERALVWRGIDALSRKDKNRLDMARCAQMMMFPRSFL